MNWTEWLKILKTDKLIALVIVLGSLSMLYLSEIIKVIDLPNTWRNIFFCTSIFCGLFLILSLVVSLGRYLKKIYINRDRDITYLEYECLEFFSKLPRVCWHLLFIINPITVAIKIYRLRQQNFDNFFWACHIE